METEAFKVFSEKGVDSFSYACRMRTTSEGQAAYGNFRKESNRLKVFEKLLQKLFEING
ncbi:hypothetical protein [Marinobacter sp. P4B1]|uniref:hypothetical protein n=1 Tax=Marinobacter sp. P4B1 TaxID=1119533 RepID=UPI000AB2ABC9|nr:hypothetical protein [Marinobacter sp. P4B1]